MKKVNIPHEVVQDAIKSCIHISQGDKKVHMYLNIDDTTLYLTTEPIEEKSFVRITGITAGTMSLADRTNFITCTTDTIKTALKFYGETKGLEITFDPGSSEGLLKQYDPKPTITRKKAKVKRK